VPTIIPTAAAAVEALRAAARPVRAREAGDATSTAQDAAKGPAAGDDCPICLAAFEAGDVAAALPACGHAFHWETCLSPWLESHHTCPVCRAALEAGEARPAAAGAGGRATGGGGGGGAGTGAGAGAGAGVAGIRMGAGAFPGGGGGRGGRPLHGGGGAPFDLGAALAEALMEVAPEGGVGLARAPPGANAATAAFADMLNLMTGGGGGGGRRAAGGGPAGGRPGRPAAADGGDRDDEDGARVAARVEAREAAAAAARVAAGTPVEAPAVNLLRRAERAVEVRAAAAGAGGPAQPDTFAPVEVWLPEIRNSPRLEAAVAALRRAVEEEAPARRTRGAASEAQGAAPRPRPRDDDESERRARAVMAALDVAMSGRDGGRDGGYWPPGYWGQAHFGARVQATSLAVTGPQGLLARLRGRFGDPRPGSDGRSSEDSATSSSGGSSSWETGGEE